MKRKDASDSEIEPPSSQQLARKTKIQVSDDEDEQSDATNILSTSSLSSLSSASDGGQEADGGK